MWRMATRTARRTSVATNAETRGRGRCGTKRCRIVRTCASMAIADVAFTAATVAVLPVYATMLAAPKWRLTKAVVTSPVPYVALAGLYVWTVISIGGVAKLAGLLTGSFTRLNVAEAASLLAKKEEVALVWIQLMLVDLFTARHIYLDGLKNGIFLAHSLVLCFMACPLGILSHCITKAVARHFRPKNQDSRPALDPSK